MKVLPLLLLLLPTMAHADIWQDCPTFIEFCKHRRYHRDCVTSGLKGKIRCVCVELRMPDDSWPRRSCGWTDDPRMPELKIEYEPWPAPEPCLQPGKQVTCK